MKNTKIKDPTNTAYKFRIEPNLKQIDILEANFRLNRDVYNFFIRQELNNDNLATLLYLKEKFPDDTILHEKVKPENKRKSFIKNGEVINFDNIDKPELRKFIKNYRTNNNLWFRKFKDKNIPNSKDAYTLITDYINSNPDYFTYIKDTYAALKNHSIDSFKSALEKCYKNQSGFPKFKKRYESNQSYSLDINNLNINIIKEYSNHFRCYIDIPKCKKLQIIIHQKEFLELVNNNQIKIKRITLSKNPSNQYFISIMVYDNSKNITISKKEINYETSIGIDSNIGELTLPDSTIELKKIMENYHKQLIKLNKQISLKKGSNKGEEKSNGYLKLRQKINKIQNKISNIRNYRNHSISNEILNLPNDTIIFEKLNIQGMIKRTKNQTDKEKQNTKKKRSMRRNILDMGWYDIQNKTITKSKLTDKNIFTIDPSNTSKTCNNCGFLNKELSLKNRTWTCPNCGKFHNRDKNASDNIKDKYFNHGAFN